MRMNQAARRQMRAANHARPFQVPAPARGWNAADPIMLMKPGEAITLDNWIPQTGYIEIRKGFKEHVVDFSTVPESFIPYRAGSTRQLFAVENGSIYAVTSAGSKGAAVKTGLTSNRVHSVNHRNDAVHATLCFNGADTPWRYNGTNWNNLTITGSSGSIVLAPADINYAMIHKKRVFLQEKNSLRVWYLDVNAIEGAAGLLDLGVVFDEGGKLVGMGVWSGYNSDNGPTAVAVFVTDQGQAAVFAGTDPSDTDDWTWVGTYAIGKPIGDRSVFKKDSDLHIITYDGIIAISAAMRAAREQQATKAITQKIKNEFARAAASYGSKFGWEATIYPSGHLAIINVPITELGRAYQFVQNIQTGAWCRFVNLSAVTWIYFEGAIFFAGTDADGQVGVYQWDTGGSDNGEAIQCDAIPAFSDFGDGRQKNFNMLQPIMQAGASVEPFVDMLTDYKLTQPTNVPESGIAGEGGIWGESLWGVGVWTINNPLRKDWTAASGVGKEGSPRIRVVSNPDAVSDVYPVVRCELIGCNGYYVPGSGI